MYNCIGWRQGDYKAIKGGRPAATYPGLICWQESRSLGKIELEGFVGGALPAGAAPGGARGSGVARAAAAVRPYGMVTWCYLRPVRGCTRGGCARAGATICLGLLTFVFDLANSNRMVWGKSGSKRTPCCKGWVRGDTPCRVRGDRALQGAG